MDELDTDSTYVQPTAKVVVASSDDLHLGVTPIPVYAVPITELEEARNDGYTPIYFEAKMEGDVDN